jgi:hypothetical protein
LPVGPPVSDQPGILVYGNGAPVDLESLWQEKSPAGVIVVARHSVFRYQRLPGTREVTAVQVVAAGTETTKDAALRLLRR